MPAITNLEFINMYKKENYLTANNNKPEVFCLGYNGANNTGSETRLLSIIEDVRSVFDSKVNITIPTFNVKNLRRYIKEDQNLKITHLPSIYHFSITNAVKNHNLIILVEGSCYMDTWTWALLWAFLLATKQAHVSGKPVVAYSVDVGEIKSSNLTKACREIDKTDLIIVRNRAAAERLKKWGITAPVEVTADSAFTYNPDPAFEGIVNDVWPEAKGKLIGFAMIDFYCWPVVMRLCGRRRDCYKWPYYFSRSKERKISTAEMAKGLAFEANRIIKKYDCYVALICMEELDESFARQVQSYITHKNRTKIFSSGQYNASQMTYLLRDLNLLVSSRYHACILSMQAGIPMIAIGHDLRLKELFEEIDFEEGFFISYKDEKLFDILSGFVDKLLENPKPVKRKIIESYNLQLERAKRSKELLESFISKFNSNTNK